MTLDSLGTCALDALRCRLEARLIGTANGPYTDRLNAILDRIDCELAARLADPA